MSIKNQLELLDSSLTNLFDSLNKPLVHENRFDLTQKINDNFKDILHSINSKIEAENFTGSGEIHFAVEDRNLNLETPNFVQKQLPDSTSIKASKKMHYLNRDSGDHPAVVKKKYLKNKSDKKSKKNQRKQSQSSAAVFGPI